MVNFPNRYKPCSVPHCPELVQGQGKCEAHERESRRKSDARRGSAKERGYTSAGHARFRRRVLSRDPLCVLCHRAPSTVADHFPLSRKELLAQGLDPNDERRGRGLCKSCHDGETATNQPGGWHARNLMEGGG